MSVRNIFKLGKFTARRLDISSNIIKRKAAGPPAAMVRRTDNRLPIKTIKPTSRSRAESIERRISRDIQEIVKKINSILGRNKIFVNKHNLTSSPSDRNLLRELTGINQFNLEMAVPDLIIKEAGKEFSPKSMMEILRRINPQIARKYARDFAEDNVGFNFTIFNREIKLALDLMDKGDFSLFRALSVCHKRSLKKLGVGDAASDNAVNPGAICKFNPKKTLPEDRKRDSKAVREIINMFGKKPLSEESIEMLAQDVIRRDFHYEDLMKIMKNAPKDFVKKYARKIAGETREDYRYYIEKMVQEALLLRENGFGNTPAEAVKYCCQSALKALQGAAGK